jgi:hypothetical protein
VQAEWQCIGGYSRALIYDFLQKTERYAKHQRIKKYAHAIEKDYQTRSFSSYAVVHYILRIDVSRSGFIRDTSHSVRLCFGSALDIE